MRRPVLVAVLTIALAFIAGRLVRAEMGIEVSSASIQAWVGKLGWKAPGMYLALVVFRHVLFIPSTIILPVGGLCFGIGVGASLGALGIALCGLGQFAIVRVARPGWVLRHLDRGVWGFERIIERAGSWLVAVVTAHPAAPMTLVHWAAGLSPLSASTFTVALALGAFVRAFTLAFFGSTLLEPRSARFYLASLLLLVVFAGPLLHPRLRQRLFGREESGGTANGDDGQR
jgi:uncharacterized membrane protein YdjX (TVP38/TMEM64 family)